MYAYRLNLELLKTESSKLVYLLWRSSGFRQTMAYQ